MWGNLQSRTALPCKRSPGRRCMAMMYRTVAVALMAMSWWGWTVDGKRHTERNTQYGRVRGFVQTVPGGKRVEKYLGVPYARPPLGNLRFEAPQPPEPWSGLLSATELPPACPQPWMGVTYIDMHIPGFNRTSEDCLYLNIHAPRHNHRNPRYPVLVFVHGGSYHNGMGAMLDGDMLATYGVIVVTFNYRLGALGFLSAPNTTLTGNYGMLDQIEALKWVKANIGHFGGDPARITIDGHSAGGCSVGLLMLSPLSKGLFTGVIEQSGSPFAHWAVSRQQSKSNLHYRLFVTTAGCSANLSAALVKRCLQQVPSDVIHSAILNQPDIQTSLVPPYRPVVDGHFLPELPEVLAAKGDVTGRYFLTGATRDEGLLAAMPLVKRYKLEDLEGMKKLLALMNCFRGDLPQVHGIVESILDAYAKWPYNLDDEQLKDYFSEIVGDYFIVAPTHKAATVMTALNLTVFVYNYEYRSDLDQWKGVIHGSELFYLAGFPFKGHTNFRYDESDKRMAQYLLQLWTNFAKNGLPSLVPLQNFHMPRFNTSHRTYTRLYSWHQTPTLAVHHDLKPEKIFFWNRHVPMMFQKQLTEFLGDGARRASAEVNTDRTGSGVRDRDWRKGLLMPRSDSWILIAACIGLSLLTVLLSVCYCQVRRQVSSLVQRNSVSHGPSML